MSRHATDEGHRPGADGRPTYSTAAQISNQMVQLMSSYTGRGPTKVRTHMNTNFVLVVLEDTLTKAERNLVAAGETDAVTRQRRTFTTLMRQQAIDAVEETTGRTVHALLSDIAPEVGIAAQLFLLDPRPETGHTVVAETRAEDVGA